jgi:hypothetical protein
MTPAYEFEQLPRTERVSRTLIQEALEKRERHISRTLANQTMSA